VRFLCAFYGQVSEKVSRRDAADLRQSAVLLGRLYHYHWPSGNGAGSWQPEALILLPLGAFAGVCYTIWAGSGIV
jgi:hypothetical protein